MKTGLYLGGTPIGKIITTSAIVGGFALQSKSVNPTKQTQTITPDAAYDALSQVIVNPIPSNYITTETTSAPEPDQMEAGTTAYANGEIITGTLPIVNSITKELNSPVVNDSKLVLAVNNDEKAIIETNATIHLQTPMEHFGNARPEDVALGKSFTSEEGLLMAGTHECPPPGADLSDVTATADMILAGYQTYVKDSDTITEGTMTNRGAVNKTLTSNTSYTIPKGYHNGSGKVTANVPVNLDTSDATATASRILSPYTAYVKGSKVTGNIATKTSSDLTTSGSTVYVPAGYYASQASKSISSGSLSSPSISVSSSGVITATSGISSSGYLSTSASNSNTKSLTTQSSKTWTPTTSNQTINSGTYLTGTQTIKGDSNLVASNIKSGVSIFGVSGSYTGGTSSGGENLTYKLFTTTGSYDEYQSIMITNMPSGSTNNIVRVYMMLDNVPLQQTYNYIYTVLYDADLSLNQVLCYRNSYIREEVADFEIVKYSSTSLNIKTQTYKFNGDYMIYIVYTE